jgi:hypothetical protein
LQNVCNWSYKEDNSEQSLKGACGLCDSDGQGLDATLWLTQRQNPKYQGFESLKARIAALMSRGRQKRIVMRVTDLYALTVL